MLALLSFSAIAASADTCVANADAKKLAGAARSSWSEPFRVDGLNLGIDRGPGFQRMRAHDTHRSRSIAFKRQVAQEFISGETLHGLAKRHDLSRNLIRLWVQKHETGAFDEDAEAAERMQEYEARIAALEQLVGRQALELEFLKGALRSGQRPRSAPTSALTGPVAFPSPRDAG